MYFFFHLFEEHLELILSSIPESKYKKYYPALCTMFRNNPLNSHHTNSTAPNNLKSTTPNNPISKGPNNLKSTGTQNSKTAGSNASPKILTNNSISTISHKVPQPLDESQIKFPSLPESDTSNSFLNDYGNIISTISIEQWMQPLISNRVNAESQTDLTEKDVFQMNIDSEVEDFEPPIQFENSQSNRRNNEVYGINLEDDDDDYYSFIASTINTDNLAMMNGKTLKAKEEPGPKSKPKPKTNKKEIERKFFACLEEITDYLQLRNNMVNDRDHHECRPCKLKFDNEFTLLNHIWQFHQHDPNLLV